MSKTDRIGEYRDLSKWSYNLDQPDPSQHVKVPEGRIKTDSDNIEKSEFGVAPLPSLRVSGR